MRSGITISDVAREAGVSKTTASFVLTDRPGIQLSPKTRQRVRETAERLGYRRSGVATALSVGRIYTVGLVIQVQAESRDVTTISTYAKDVIVAMACACSRAGLRMTTILNQGNETTPITDSPEKFANELADGRVDGLILSGLRDEALARAIYSTGFPAVSVGSGYSERRIAIDNQGGAYAATKHLLALGHRRIGYVTYRDLHPHSFSSFERQQGYEAALREQGCTPWVLQFEQAFDELDRSPEERCTALFCFNDTIAEPLSREAQRRGLSIPGDLSLIGFDNSIIARLSTPALTSVDHPLDDLSDTAITALLALWRGESEPAIAPLPTHLIIRHSTAAPILKNTEVIP